MILINYFVICLAFSELKFIEFGSVLKEIFVIEINYYVELFDRYVLIQISIIL